MAAKNNDPSPEEQALENALALRREMQETGEFLVAEYETRLKKALKCFSKHALDGFCRHIAAKVDRSMSDAGRGRHKGPRDQGELFDLGGEYATGEGTRIRKDLAMVEHADKALRQKKKNMDNVTKAFSDDFEELSLLRPYWVGCTKKEAVEAYYRNNHGGAA